MSTLLSLFYTSRKLPASQGEERIRGRKGRWHPAYVCYQEVNLEQQIQRVSFCLVPHTIFYQSTPPPPTLSQASLYSIL